MGGGPAVGHGEVDLAAFDGGDVDSGAGLDRKVLLGDGDVRYLVRYRARCRRRLLRGRSRQRLPARRGRSPTPRAPPSGRRAPTLDVWPMPGWCRDSRLLWTGAKRSAARERYYGGFLVMDSVICQDLGGVGGVGTTFRQRSWCVCNWCWQSRSAGGGPVRAGDGGGGREGPASVCGVQREAGRPGPRRVAGGLDHTVSLRSGTGTQPIDVRVASARATTVLASAALRNLMASSGSCHPAVPGFPAQSDHTAPASYRDITLASPGKAAVTWTRERWIPPPGSPPGTLAGAWSWRRERAMTSSTAVIPKRYRPRCLKRRSARPGDRRR